MARPTEVATITAEPNEAAALRSLAEHLDSDGGAVALKDAAMRLSFRVRSRGCSRSWFANLPTGTR